MRGRRWWIVPVLALAACTGKTAGTAALDPGFASSLPSASAAPTEAPTTAEPTTAEPTTAEPTTAEPTTAEPTTAEPTTTPAGRPCPNRVNRAIPGGADATIADGYRTAHFQVLICARSDGALFYGGISAADPNRTIVLPATRSGTGYRAENTVTEQGASVSYRYVITPDRLTVLRNSATLLTEPVTGSL